MRARAALLGILLIVASLSSLWAQGQCELWTEDIGPIILGPNDDGSVGPIQLPFPVPVNGNTYTQFWINNNGNVTFTGPLGDYTAFAFPNNRGIVIVAPFFADVDTRPAASGKVHYRATNDYIVVTWNNVGYYNQRTDKLNRFQLIITRDGYAGFSYANMQWTTGDASGGSGGFGGSPARAGFDAGNRRDALVFWEGNTPQSLERLQCRIFWYNLRTGRPIQSSPTPPTPAGTPNVAWGPLVRVSPRPNGWDSDTKRLVAGKRVNNVLYLAFSHDRRLSDALTFSYNSGRVEVRLTQQGVYWVPANSISSLTQISDTLEIPAYVVVKRSGSDPAICYGINACNLLGNDVEEFYAICLCVMLSNGERVPRNQTTVMDYLKAIGQSNQIPPHLLWAIAWEETHPEFRWSHVRRDGWSLLTFDGGIGMMQLTQGSAVWGPRDIGGGWLDNRVIPNDLLTHLYKLAADWQYNVRAGSALLNLPAGRVLGPPDGTLVRPVLEHWWFRVWVYNGGQPRCRYRQHPCGGGLLSTYPERIRLWLSDEACDTLPYGTVGPMNMIGLPAFMQYGSCNAGISFAPTPYPANIDIDFDGTIDARIKGVSSPSNLWDNNGELYFQVESLSSVPVQEVRVLNAEAREQYRQAGGGTIRCCAGLQSGYIVVRLNNTDVKTYFSRSQQFIWRTPGDVNGDGCVDDADLLEVLFAFGCSTGCGVEDINGDGVVDDADLLEVLFNFGASC